MRLIKHRALRQLRFEDRKMGIELAAGYSDWLFGGRVDESLCLELFHGGFDLHARFGARLGRQDVPGQETQFWYRGPRCGSEICFSIQEHLW